MIVTFLFLLATFRSSVGLSGVFFFLVTLFSPLSFIAIDSSSIQTITFLLLGTAEMTGKAGVATAGGQL